MIRPERLAICISFAMDTEQEEEFRLTDEKVDELSVIGKKTMPFQHKT